MVALPRHAWLSGLLQRASERARPCPSVGLRMQKEKNFPCFAPGSPASAGLNLIFPHVVLKKILVSTSRF